MKITCECLVVANPMTGELEPLVLDWPDGKIRELHNLRVKAYESGLRFKKGLSAYVGDTLEGFNKASLQVAELLSDISADDNECFKQKRDPLSEFSEQLSRKVFERSGISKEDFVKIWDKTLGPALEDGSVTWECSDRLAEYLTRIGNDELSCGEIFELIEDDKV